jgi:hypothetical protein
MQKVEGSNPFSRFEKGLHLQVFFVGAVRCRSRHGPRRARQAEPLTRLRRGLRPNASLLVSPPRRPARFGSGWLWVGLGPRLARLCAQNSRRSRLPTPLEARAATRRRRPRDPLLRGRGREERPFPSVVRCHTRATGRDTAVLHRHAPAPRSGPALTLEQPRIFRSASRSGSCTRSVSLARHRRRRSRGDPRWARRWFGRRRNCICAPRGPRPRLRTLERSGPGDREGRRAAPSPWNRHVAPGTRGEP